MMGGLKEMLEVDTDYNMIDSVLQGPKETQLVSQAGLLSTEQRSFSQLFRRLIQIDSRVDSK